MRRRTPIQSIFQPRNEFVGGVLLVGLRIWIGVQCLAQGIQGVGVSSVDRGASMRNALEGMEGAGILAWVLIAIGIALLLGCMVRIFALGGIVLAIAGVALEVITTGIIGIFGVSTVYVLLFGLFASGGFGHVFGIDGMIFERLQEKKQMRTLFFG